MHIGELLRICAEKPQFLRMFSGEALEACFDGKDVLEIGCGPCGISLASFYPKKQRIHRLVKCEPLPRQAILQVPCHAASDRRFLEWAEELSLEGEYWQVKGEELGTRDAFDTVITFNVLDHVSDPLSVLQNAYGCLKPGGILLVGVDCRSILGKVKFDQITRHRAPDSMLVQAHPFTFHVADVERLMRKAGFADTQRIGDPSTMGRLVGKCTRPGFLGRKLA